MLVFAAFFLLWLLMSGEVNAHVCLYGAAASAAMMVFCHRVLGWSLGMRSPGKLIAWVRYGGYLLAEMMKSAWLVMKLVYTKCDEVEPRLVWFRTTLKSDAARAVLADSITLTPGTFTVLAEQDGRFCVHALDQSLAEGIEFCEFQRRLEKLEE